MERTLTNDLQTSARDTEGETLDVLRKVFDEQFKKIPKPSPKLEEPTAAATPPGGRGGERCQGRAGVEAMQA